jgi:nucleoside-diphosphate-sugar epimerase
MKKILITGGSGFIGSHLTRLLFKKGYKVAITTKYNSIYENIRISDLWGKIEVIEMDLRNYNSIDKINKFRPDTIFHLAAYNDVGGSFDNFNEAITSNMVGTANLIEGIKNYKQFIYISTSEVYGEQKNKPFVETMIPQPVSPYSVGKYGGELYANMFMNFYKKPIKIIRPFNAFGPWQSVKAVIPEIIMKCINNEDVEITSGEQTREFNYVENLVNGFYICAKNKKCFGEVVNIGNGADIKIKNLAKLIFSLIKPESNLYIGKLKSRITDIKKMQSNSLKFKKITRWRPNIEFKDGLSKTIDWYKKQNLVYNHKTSSFSKLFKF